MKQVEMNNSVSAQQDDWSKMCTLAATNKDAYKIFRSTKTFQRVIEGSTISCGLWNLKRLVRNTNFIKALDLIQKSETIGLPLNTIRVDIGDKIYNLSPTTIRYANNAINCQKLFGNKIFSGKVNICEIGAGYGGECKVLNDISTSTNGRNLKNNWFIYDLSTSIKLIAKFLDEFNYMANFLKPTDELLISSKDYLVISNGAFSEMRGELLNHYFDKAIKKAKYGYFITNFESHSAPYGGWTTDEFVKKLSSCGKKNVTVLPTSQYLSYFDKQANSKLVVFGHKIQPTIKIKFIETIYIKTIEFLNFITHKLSDKFIQIYK